MKIFLLFACILSANLADAYNPTVSPQEELKELMDGNERYVKDALEHPNRTSIRREASQSVQLPQAVVVACSDSRVSPEIIFDQGIGDLFIVRVAGNVIGPLEQESIEYGVLVLNAVLVLVLGHEKCGAVRAVLEGKDEAIPTLAHLIEPAVEETKGKDTAGVLKAAIKANAIRMKDFLLRSKKLGELAKKKRIEIKAGYYNLSSGEVEIL